MEVDRPTGHLWKFGAVGVLAGLAAFLVPVPAQALHDGFHGHSVAYEQSLGYIYEGVRVDRPDLNLVNRGIPNDGCNAPYQGHPVYQTQWIIFNQNATDWVEGGTGHQCNGNFRYRFWGFGQGGNWFPAGHVHIATANSHQFSLYKTFAHNWYYYVGSTRVGTAVNWNRRGIASAGLESYATNAQVVRHQYGDLRERRNETWTRWAGRDSEVVHPRPRMCGTWSSTSEWFWYASENAAC